MLRREPVQPILGLHPGLILAALDLIGLFIAGYLAVVEVGGGLPACGPLKGCETVAQSEYSRIGGIPVAVYGVVLSLTLLTLALAWWRTNFRGLLLLHYGLSLGGVIFEIYFLYIQIAVIRAVCVWCASYGLSLILRFVVALIVWLRQTRGVEPAP
ncbi:MAG: vitamin K epoxide reductase family protein [Chloroflexota bacterium]